MTDNQFDPCALVGEFTTAFETSDSVDLWLKLVGEEHDELLEAMALDVTDNTVQSLSNVLKEAADYLYVFSGLDLVLEKRGLMVTEEQIANVANLLAEVIDIFGEEVFEEAFRRVHASNMSKLGDDGKPVRREDGKVLKGPNYQPPVLTDLVVEAYSKTNPNPSYLVQV